MDTKMVEALKGFKFFDLLYAGFLFLGTLAPGFLILYLYQPALVRQLDSFKLCLFCFALTAPVLLINCILSSIIDPSLNDFKDEPAKEKILRQTFGYSGFISFAVLYPTLVAAYFGKLEFKYFLAAVGIFEVVLFAIAMIREQYHEKKDKTKEQLNTNP